MSKHNSTNGVERGVRKEDVAALVAVITSDDNMRLPMIPDPVAKIIYTSAIKLSFNVFYKSLANLDGLDIVTSSSNSSNMRELRLDRLTRGGSQGGNSTISDQQTQKARQQQWKSFQSTMDPKPLEALADSLLQNEAVNLTVVPDAVEKQVYVNSLKIIFWIIHLISSTVKITFCGHALSLEFAPAPLPAKYFGSRSHPSIIIIAATATAATIDHPETH